MLLFTICWWRFEFTYISTKTREHEIEGRSRQPTTSEPPRVRPIVMITANPTRLEICGHKFSISRPHRFGLVIEGPPEGASQDYLHDVLLSPRIRNAFLALIDVEGLVICKNVRSNAASYRKVRGKSSHGKLSQAEYYHHDGCSCPTKPRVVEIRLPHQEIARQVATAIAPFPDVIRSMLMALPKRLQSAADIARCWALFSGSINDLPPIDSWDKIQGRVTRLVRREMDAQSCRAYFRDVDQIAGSYDLPWEMGESRLMANNLDDLTKTMQHRRAYQRPRETNEENGSLVKRWTAEEA